jgi:hypothetical protein
MYCELEAIDVAVYRQERERGIEMRNADTLQKSKESAICVSQGALSNESLDTANFPFRAVSLALQNDG